MTIRPRPPLWPAVALFAAVLIAPVTASPIAAVPASPATASLLDVHGNHPHDNGVKRTLPRTQGSSVSTLPSNLTTGVVLIDTVINYDQGAAAGSGFLLRSDGIVVTNHHVVEGSTSIIVSDASTGERYPAEVLGYDKTNDIAVLQLPHVTGLNTVQTNSSPAMVGQSITAVGNAQGGGVLVSVTGLITGTGITIRVSNDGGTSKSTLTNLIQISAALVPGDSGGPLFSSQYQVIGMNVAGAHDTSANESYCIPIPTVLSVEHSVLTGESSPGVTIGRPAGLGLTLSDKVGSGSLVDWVYADGPAGKAGITIWSTLISIDEKSVSSPGQLSQLLAGYSNGDKVSVTWNDFTGKQHSATITLGNAPLP